MNKILSLHRTSGRLRSTGESGQALVETAVSLGMLLIILIGAVEIGRIAYATIQVTNAAKAAVQYGAQNHNTAVDTTGMQTAAASEAPLLPNLNTAPSAPVCTCANDGTSVSCSDTTACPASTSIETITVQTSATFDPLFHIPGTPTTYTLTGQAVQQVLSIND